MSCGIFHVICYNPVLQIKMMTTVPSGTCMKTSRQSLPRSSRLRPVDKRKLLLHYIGRSLRACLLVLLSSHCFVLSRSKHDSGGHMLSLSLLIAGHRSSWILSVGEGEKVQSSRGRPRRRLLPTASASRSACLVVLSQASLAREGLPPLLPRCRSVGRSGLPPPT